jgi:hypothetical protein
MTYKRAVTHFAIALAAHAKDKLSLNLNTRAGQCALWPWLCSCAHYSQHMKAVLDLPPTHSGPRNTWNKKLRLRNKYWVNMAGVRTEEVYSYVLCFRIVSQEELWSLKYQFSSVWRDRGKKTQQDATVRCLLLTSVSTCFGHHYAHLQENKGRVAAFGVLLWFCWMCW